MSAVDSLPGDQRAVLQLVLGRGRSYDEIARLLTINPGAVQERAVAALRALGPQTDVDPDAQAAITDYLLGQLPEDQMADVRERLAASPAERAWARVVASELTSLASGPLPEIPTESSPSETEPTTPVETSSPTEAGPAPPAEAETPPADAAPATPPPAPTPPPTTGPSAGEDGAGDGGTATATGPRVSRRGGLVIIGLVVAIIIVVVIIVATSGGGGSKHSSTTVASTPSTPSATSSTAPASGSSTASTASSSSTTTSSTSTSAKVIAQINLTPTSSSSKAAGIAEVLREGTTDGIAIVAQNVPPNTTHPPNAYAVWLYNSPTDAKILGFVNPGVPKTGKLSTAGGLPANASHYKQLIVTVETSANPKKPGTIILQGTLSGV